MNEDPLHAETANQVALRTPDHVMRLARFGATHQTRLSFLRTLLRRMSRERWTIDRPRFDIDARGVGVAVYRVRVPAGRTYSLVAFSHDLPADQRTDRVIAEAWDATFALYDGDPDNAAIARLADNVPRQEAGRYRATELVLARANRSVRLFEHVVDALAGGRCPDAELLEATGYLMRTTAVYGNGKFGIADRDRIADRTELAGPFQAEMLTVYLIRAFSVDLVEHLARCRAPEGAVPLPPALRRRLGIGNATGLGMAPFLVKHPALINNWIAAREEALARVRNIEDATEAARRMFLSLLPRVAAMVARWHTDDPVQSAKILRLRNDFDEFATFACNPRILEDPFPWDRIYRFSTGLSLEAQELAVSLLLEPHGDLIDDLAETMGADEQAASRIDGRMTVEELRSLIRRHYLWARLVDYTRPEATARFWYVSEEKLEPRLGLRHEEPGADREQPLAVGRDVNLLADALADLAPETRIAEFLLRAPEHRHVVRRIQAAARMPYAEIRNNLIDLSVRAVDILRLKLAFFGVTRFDPRSDKWLRITLYQGAPFPAELLDDYRDDWIYGPVAAP